MKQMLRDLWNFRENARRILAYERANELRWAQMRAAQGLKPNAGLIEVLEHYEIQKG